MPKRTRSAMTPASFRARQEVLALSNGDLALQLGVSKSSVEKYRAGSVPVPATVAKLMESIAVRGARG